MASAAPRRSTSPPSSARWWGHARAPSPTRDLEIGQALAPATIAGDARLVERLVSNLVDNAIRHNVPGGRVDVAVRSGGRATLTVANTGPVVPPEEVERLLQPFQRLSADRTSHRDGLGLGLSIVTAIAGAHDAVLAVRARPDGGLEIDVHFPARSTPRPAEPAPCATPCEGWDHDRHRLNARSRPHEAARLAAPGRAGIKTLRGRPNEREAHTMM